ncbi:glycosyltransferase [Ruicaihuangia caeni]|uniref:Glycosyltransferase family 4 protein n=1 Tax=Ruicaihuangia caeni TaxID=3042517 RepID=A0AAW6T7Y7_9MICO|nr:hypothetical protein [Klugiella sp. YN-L-19]MDI2099339.1 hypothetical protein [Klugiella sp. YN-L-19]
MREYVRTLAADPALRARMGEAGRRRVLSRTWESVCIDLFARYEEVIAARRQATSPMSA